MTDLHSAPHGYLAEPELTDDVRELYDGDLSGDGYVMNLTRLWAHSPSIKRGLFDLITQAFQLGGLSFRQRGILITAMASTMGDSYCSLAWGTRLADESSAAAAVGVVGAGALEELTPAELALAQWARLVASDPNGTAASDVEVLRDAGFDDTQIFAITTFIALRQAFSTVNDALGARPDRQLVDAAPEPLQEAVSFGRLPAVELS